MTNTISCLRKAYAQLKHVILIWRDPQTQLARSTRATRRSFNGIGVVYIFDAEKIVMQNC